MDSAHFRSALVGVQAYFSQKKKKEGGGLLFNARHNNCLLLGGVANCKELKSWEDEEGERTNERASSSLSRVESAFPTRVSNMMASRKRILALRRAPDGSAFQKCNLCGVSVAIALNDMHQCKVKKTSTGKKTSFKCVEEETHDQNLNKPSVCDQPRSPFRIFMESFKKANQNDDWIDVDSKGFEAWKYMSMEERQCYVVLAEKVNLVYEQLLLEEMEDKDGLEEDDEADSAWVGKIDLSYYDDTIDVWENSESFEYVMDHHW